MSTAANLKASGELTFSNDWFTPNIKNWQQHAQPLLQGKPVVGLELGSYEGMSAIWTLQNMLDHEKSRLTCIDIWWNQENEQNFDRNIVTAGVSTRLHKRKGDALDELRRINTPLDYAYIDADHLAFSVVMQFSLLWPILKKGAVVIFDDYLWQLPDAPHYQGQIPPKPGIDAILELWQSRVEILHKGYQVIVRKT